MSATRRQLLIWLGGAVVVALAVGRGVWRVLGPTDDGRATRVEVGGPGGPVLRVVPLDEDRIGGPSDLAG